MDLSCNWAASRALLVEARGSSALVTQYIVLTDKELHLCFLKGNCCSRVVIKSSRKNFSDVFIQKIRVILDSTL